MKLFSDLFCLSIFTLSLLTLSLLSVNASAQFSVIEYDSGPGFNLLRTHWTPSFFSLANVENDRFENGGRLSTYNYLSFSTFVSDSLRFKLRLPFTYGSAGTDRFNGDKANVQELQLQDIILCWQSSNFLLLPLDIGTYWEGRVYLPNSKSSKDSGLITRLRNDIILTKMFSRSWALEYNNKLGYYQQSRRSYPVHFQDELGFDVEATAATKHWDLDHWLNLWARPTSTVSVGWALGEEVTNYNRSATEKKNKPEEHILKTGPTVRFPIGSHATFLLNYSDKVNRSENQPEFGRFLAKNSEVTLLSFITF